MNTMNVPGFTAGRSLYKAAGHYRMNVWRGEWGITPQQLGGIVKTPKAPGPAIPLGFTVRGLKECTCPCCINNNGSIICCDVLGNKCAGSLNPNGTCA